MFFSKMADTIRIKKEKSYKLKDLNCVSKARFCLENIGFAGMRDLIK